MFSRRYSWILKLAIVLLLVVENHAAGCNVKIPGKNYLATPQPLILSPKVGLTSYLTYLYPSRDDKGDLHTATGDSVRLACPGSKLILNAPGNHDNLLLKCQKDTTFTTLFSTKTESFGKITCEKHPTFVIKRTTQECSTGVPYTIGNSIVTETSKTTKRTDFLPLIDLCHDEKLAHTVWAHAKISASIGWGQAAAPRIDFRTEGFYVGLTISKLYEIKTQQETVGRIMNDKAHAISLVHRKGGFFLSRGHLIASADFIYRSQQRATFYYVNAVPMWQNINQGNWATMERNVRSYAFSRKHDLDVWTGSIGILRLPDKKSVPHQIYLQYGTGRDKHVQVPKILYRIVYEPISKAAVVFLTANNPYIKQLGEYQICKNICKQINYLTWKPNESVKGLSYCCEYNNFKKSIPRSPTITVTKLLV